ncbi:MAG: pilus assembly protein [Candidatus Dormibacteria bacterium]
MLVVVSLMSVLIFGIAALVIDQGISMADRRDLQTYSDSAALAGARQYQYTAGVDAAHYVAMQFLAKTLGFPSPSTGSPVAGNGGGVLCTSPSTCPAGTYAAAGGAYAITLADSAATFDVAVQHARSPLLAGVLGIGSLSTGSSARIALSTACPAFCVLNPRLPGALTVSGSPASLAIAGGSLVVNSSAPDGITINTGTLALNPGDGSIGVVGGFRTVGGGSISPTPAIGVPPVVEPPVLANMPVPAFPPGTAVQSMPPITTDLYLNPGVYNRIDVTGGGHAFLNPGIYVITGGMSAVAMGEIDSVAPGVTLYFTCSSWPAPCAPGQAGASLSLDGTGDADLTAPASGTYQGLALFYDRNNTSSTVSTGSSALEVHGTIYSRSGGLEVTGNAAATPIDSAIIVDHLTITGTSSINAEYRDFKNVPNLVTAGNAGPGVLSR